MIECPQCGYENPDSNNFCGQCGAEITSDKDEGTTTKAQAKIAVIQEEINDLREQKKSMERGGWGILIVFSILAIVVGVVDAWTTAVSGSGMPFHWIWVIVIGAVLGGILLVRGWYLKMEKEKKAEEIKKMRE